MSFSKMTVMIMERPLSMTGFGRGENIGNGKKWTAEIRSVNHRFLDIRVRLPRQYMLFEERIKKAAAAYYSRGHIDIFLDVVEEEGESGRLRIDLPLAREYHNCLRRIKEDLQLQGEPDLQMLASFKDVIVPGQDEDIAAQDAMIWPVAEEALEAALKNAAHMRSQEGRALKQDLEERLTCFVNVVNRLEASLPEIAGKKESSLKERLENLLAGVDLDPQRLAQEVAIIVDKSDVTEELVRLRSHMQQFESFLSLAEPIGRRIDFLVQEFLRELNTIASKINDAEVAHMIVDLKTELEKMREQVQNLE
jgi:uncharacterized protein (TIGR00255 family)